MSIASIASWHSARHSRRNAFPVKATLLNTCEPTVSEECKATTLSPEGCQELIPEAPKATLNESQCFRQTSGCDDQRLPTQIYQWTPWRSLPPWAQASLSYAIFLPSMLVTEEPAVILSDVVGIPVHSKLSNTVAIGTPSIVKKLCCVDITSPLICGFAFGSTIGQTSIWAVSETDDPM